MATTSNVSARSTEEAKPARARENSFDWPVCYEAEELVLNRINAFLARNRFARTLADRMLKETATLMIDWTDHLLIPAGDEAAFRRTGFIDDPGAEVPGDRRPLHHPKALLPRVLVIPGIPALDYPATLALRVESLPKFLSTFGLAVEPDGDPLSRFRRALVAQENDARLEAVERRGYRGYIPSRATPGEIQAFLKAQELWGLRQRSFTNDAAGYESTHQQLDRVIDLVGRDLACHIVFEGERRYWQSRNSAARQQKVRQSRLGLGWANHDHHTFRSSRRHFVDLMRVLDKLGFERRERYYAGAQAGWGAQISEQEVEGIVTFCDVDLTPDETEIDFSRKPLPAVAKLGTIGLWVGLHGDSLLEAGMHHLECRFDYQLLRQHLAALQIQTMNPFSDFPFLKQAFTEGERWPVLPDRAKHLLAEGLITPQQFDQFTREGAIGSHLENLQRKGGFKGFNQKSVSVIIEATDPRKQSH